MDGQHSQNPDAAASRMQWQGRSRSPRRGSLSPDPSSPSPPRSVLLWTATAGQGASFREPSARARAPSRALSRSPSPPQRQWPRRFSPGLSSRDRSPRSVDSVIAMWPSPRPDDDGADGDDDSSGGQRSPSPRRRSCGTRLCRPRLFSTSPPSPPSSQIQRNMPLLSSQMRMPPRRQRRPGLLGPDASSLVIRRRSESAGGNANANVGGPAGVLRRPESAAPDLAPDQY